MEAPLAPAHRLEAATSTYLRQHAGDQVEWMPWGPESLERARQTQRLIFLSIGFATCHWCHVMAAESFQDARVGAELSRLFVCIKVDREEQAAVDSLYVRLVQEMTGSAGWPLTVILTPDLEPVWGGTYLSPFAGRGGPGLLDVARGVAGAWTQGPERLRERAAKSLERLRRSQQRDQAGELPTDLLERSRRSLLEDYDPDHGGFGGAPKFLHSEDLRLLLRHGQQGHRASTEAALWSLERMAAGGVHDQLSGGFHRYSTDESWLVPHFEKLLCDTALMIPAYLEGYLVSGRPVFASVVRRACDWLRAELRTPEGALAAGLDADGDGGEGAHCTWTQDELVEALGPRRGGRAQELFGVDLESTMEDGRSVLWLAERVADGCSDRADPYADPEFLELAAELAPLRARRRAPIRDELVVAGWNGLALSALAQAYQVLGRDQDLELARSVAAHLRGVHLDPAAGLFACSRGDRAEFRGTLEDHAFVAQGLLDLYETDFDEELLHDALGLVRSVEADFQDPEDGGYFESARDGSALPMRTKQSADGALPSGHGVHALNLVRLARWTGQAELAAAAQNARTSVAAALTRQPRSHSSLLLAHDAATSDPLEIAIAGAPEAADTLALLGALRSSFRPQRVVALAHASADSDLLPWTAERYRAGEAAQAHVCRSWSCTEPTADPEELQERLEP